MGWRASELFATLRDMGFETCEPSSGSHWKIKRDGQRTVPIALHNGLRTEIDKKWMRIIARELNVNVETLTGIGKKSN